MIILYSHFVPVTNSFLHQLQHHVFQNIKYLWLVIKSKMHG
uniref:Uncharacterized protein n=1 Tax=Anguilla anguilla TaxID=7936 RepID=A0A0E9TQQ1_ANGAN